MFSGSSFDDPIKIGQLVTVEGVELVVVGTADDAAFNVLPTLYVPFEDYVTASQERAGAPIDVAPSLIGVTVAEGADPEAVARSLTASIDGIEALDRSAAVDALPGVSSITQSFSILYLLLYLVVAIVTGVFFLILTVQKEDALVLLRAVGASSRDLIGSVLIQALMVVGLGALIGVSGHRRAAGPDPRRLRRDPQPGRHRKHHRRDRCARPPGFGRRGTPGVGHRSGQRDDHRRHLTHEDRVQGADSSATSICLGRRGAHHARRAPGRSGRISSTVWSSTRPARTEPTRADCSSSLIRASCSSRGRK